MKLTAILAPLTAAILLFATTGVAAQAPSGPRGRTAQAVLGTAFTYQGQLGLNGSAVADTCDFAFSLYNAATGGNQVGSTQSASGQSVRQGSFAVPLDFGASAFGGEARWIETAVRCPAGGGSYTTLSPRQGLTAVPSSLYAASAGALQGRAVAARTPSTGDVLRWDGGQWVPGSAFTRTLVVGPVGSETQNGAALQAAIGSISGSSSSNPYLIKLEPGVYDLGSAPLRMREFVDVEGSGEMTTLIKSAGFGDQPVGTIVGANSSELRSLSVLNSGGAANATAVYLPAATRLRNVTAAATGGTSSNYSVRVDGASPRLTHVTAIASGDGFVTSFGTHVTGFSDVSVAHSSLQAGGGAWTRALFASGSGVTVTIVDSELVSTGGVHGIGASIEGGATGHFTNVRSRAAGTTEARAFDFAETTTSSVENSQGTAEEPGTANYGLAASRSTLRVRGSTFSAMNAGRSEGIALSVSSMTLDRSTAIGTRRGMSTASTIAEGDTRYTGGIVQIDQSKVTHGAADGYGIEVVDGYLVLLGGSGISSITGPGGRRCAMTYGTSAGNALNSSCAGF